jgi:hypothetical protein
VTPWRYSSTDRLGFQRIHIFFSPEDGQQTRIQLECAAA